MLAVGTVDSREPGAAPVVRTSRRRSATLARRSADQADEDDPDRTASLSVGSATSERPAIPHPAAHARGGLGRCVRGDRHRTAPRGGAEADPGEARRRPVQPRAVHRRGRDHRRRWSTRASSPSMAWAPMPAGVRTTPCGSSRVIRSRRRSRGFTPTNAEGGRRPPVAGVCASSCAGSSTSATPSITPTRAG